MQIAAETTKSQSLPGATLSEFSVTVRQPKSFQYRVIPCNGAVVSFEPSEVSGAATKVFLEAEGMQDALPAELQLEGIDDRLSKPLYLRLRCQIGRAPGLDQFIRPIR
jgi:hypothetical protein